MSTPTTRVVVEKYSFRLDGMFDSVYRRQCETEIQTWQDGETIYHQGEIKEISIHRKMIVLEDQYGIDCISVVGIVKYNYLD